MTLFSSQPIGVYDSGIGGLTVLQELIKTMPHHDFIYVADTENLPYGTKTPEQLHTYARDIAQWMQTQHHVQGIVVACHTSSAIAIPSLSLDIPIIDTITPLCTLIDQKIEQKRLVILATPASIQSRTHEAKLRSYGYTGEIINIPCPDFVPLIEQGLLDGDLLSAPLFRAIHHHLAPLLETPGRADAVMFGCTHYPFIKKALMSVLPLETVYIDPAVFMARQAAEAFGVVQMKDTQKPGQIQFYCSANIPTFQAKIQRLFPGAVARLSTLRAPQRNAI